MSHVEWSWQPFGLGEIYINLWSKPGDRANLMNYQMKLSAMQTNLNGRKAEIGKAIQRDSNKATDESLNASEREDYHGKVLAHQAEMERLNSRLDEIKELGEAVTTAQHALRQGAADITARSASSISGITPLEEEYLISRADTMLYEEGDFQRQSLPSEWEARWWERSITCFVGSASSSI